jgi:hypothetical protein
MICNWKHLTDSNMPIYTQSERITKEVCKKHRRVQQKFKAIILEVLVDQ